MRRYVIAIIAAVSLALSGGQAYAQRCLPGMKGLELRGGLVGGSSGDFYLGTAMSVYSGRANRWVFGACKRATATRICRFPVRSSRPKGAIT